MSGHSHWKQIQSKKGVADQKRGQLFSKLLVSISIAARQDSNPDFNPRLRSAIEKAKQYNVPSENIERAIKKAYEEKNLEEIIIEGYGPGKIAMIIKAITNNKNRAISEIRHLLNENNAKMAEPGSVLWAFNPPISGSADSDWHPKFSQSVSLEDRQKIEELIQKLEKHDDVQKIITNL